MRITATFAISIACLVWNAPARAQNAAAPGASAPAQTQTSSAPKAPPPPRALGTTGQLAPWLQVRGEFRARIEGFGGGGFADNSDAYWLDRFRLNATVRPSRSILFAVQAQDARAFQKTSGGRAVPFRDTWDLRLAYGEYTQPDFGARVGRQELAFGEQRLPGHLAWANTARSFDAGRVTLKRPGAQVDLFAASVVTIRPDTFDKSGNGNRLYGAYGSVTSLVPNGTVEPYVIWRQATGIAAELGATAALHQATTGVRLAGKWPADFDYSQETALQTGSAGPDAIRAWANHSLVGRTLSGAPARPRLFGEYNYASGDANRTDGTRGTFDQLYPTGHDKLGLSDQVGWRNIHHARAGIELKPASKWQVAGSYHSWWLANAFDGLYSASGGLVARSAAGIAGRHVGQELDGQLSYVYSSQLQISAGYAHLLPGEFLKKTTQGRTYSYPFVMATYVFVGDKPAGTGAPKGR